MSYSGNPQYKRRGTEFILKLIHESYSTLTLYSLSRLCQQRKMAPRCRCNCISCNKRCRLQIVPLIAPQASTNQWLMASVLTSKTFSACTTKHPPMSRLQTAATSNKYLRQSSMTKSGYRLCSPSWLRKCPGLFPYKTT